MPDSFDEEFNISDEEGVAGTQTPSATPTFNLWVTKQEVNRYGLVEGLTYPVQVEGADLEEGLPQLYIEGFAQKFRLTGINLMGIHPGMTVGLEVDESSRKLGKRMNAATEIEAVERLAAK